MSYCFFATALQANDNMVVLNKAFSTYLSAAMNEITILCHAVVLRAAWFKQVKLNTTNA